MYEMSKNDEELREELGRFETFYRLKSSQIASSLPKPEPKWKKELDARRRRKEDEQKWIKLGPMPLK